MLFKLSDWCAKAGVKYMTAWRWFNSGQMPVKAYKDASDYIWVEDEFDENDLPTPKDSAVAVFVKKVAEYIRNGQSVEDFAFFIISNFELKLIEKEPIAPSRFPKKDRERQSKEAQDYIKGTVKDIAPSGYKLSLLKKLKASIKEQSDGYIGSRPLRRDLEAKCLSEDGIELQGLSDPKNEDWLTNDDTLARMIEESFAVENDLSDIVVESPTAPQKEQETLGAQDLPQTFEKQIRKTQ